MENKDTVDKYVDEVKAEIDQNVAEFNKLVENDSLDINEIERLMSELNNKNKELVSNLYETLSNSVLEKKLIKIKKQN